MALELDESWFSSLEPTQAVVPPNAKSRALGAGNLARFSLGEKVCRKCDLIWSGLEYDNCSCPKCGNPLKTRGKVKHFADMIRRNQQAAEEKKAEVASRICARCGNSSTKMVKRNDQLRPVWRKDKVFTGNWLCYNCGSQTHSLLRIVHNPSKVANYLSLLKKRSITIHYDLKLVAKVLHFKSLSDLSSIAIANGIKTVSKLVH